jgi:hypothetical protein
MPFNGMTDLLLTFKQVFVIIAYKNKRPYQTKGGQKMPPIFKALASITAWILFIMGCLGIVLMGVARITKGDTPDVPIVWGLAVFSLLAGVVAMKLRHTLE